VATKPSTLDRRKLRSKGPGPFELLRTPSTKLSEKGLRGLQCGLTDYPKALFVLRTPAKFTLGALLELPFRTVSLEDVFSEVRIPDPA
jgi:hypothetical protein